MKTIRQVKVTRQVNQVISDDREGRDPEVIIDLVAGMAQGGLFLF